MISKNCAESQKSNNQVDLILVLWTIVYLIADLALLAGFLRIYQVALLHWWLLKVLTFSSTQNVTDFLHVELLGSEIL